MYSGWIRPFTHGPRISPSERSRQLLIDQLNAVSDQHAGLIRFNSSFLEMIDRRFRQRGMFLTLLSLLGAGFFLGFWVYAWIDSTTTNGEASGIDGFFVFVTILLMSGIAVISKLVLLKDFFTYTHYPIRFDRRHRMVHAFLGRSDGGIVSVPWDDAFFHIGRDGDGETFLRDLRCHVLDKQGQIRRTFAVGHYFDDEARVVEVWEFIRRYMEEGPDDVFDEPQVSSADARDGLEVPRRRIDLSIVPSLRNTFDWVVLAMPGAWFRARYWLIPLYGPLVICRWLVMKSCRAPSWPKAIEAASVADPSDPWRLIEPRVHAQWGARLGFD